MNLLLDEMYSVVVAEQLRARGHEVLSVNAPDYGSLRSAPERDVFRAAMMEGRALVTENVKDFAAFEAEALGAAFRPVFIYTTHRQFPRQGNAAIGRLVSALDVLLGDQADLPVAHSLEPGRD